MPGNEGDEFLRFPLTHSRHAHVKILHEWFQLAVVSHALETALTRIITDQGFYK